MIKFVKDIYRRFLATLMLFTAEMLLSISFFIIALILFIAISKAIFIDNQHVFDQDAFNFAAGFVNERNTSIMLFLTWFGDSQFLLPANIALTVYFLFVRKHKWYSIKIPVISLGSVSLMFLLKELFNRSRPLIPLLEPARGLSFPSGHAMSSMTFFGLIIYFIWHQEMDRNLKAFLIILLIIVILGIGFSRVYLRVHYASDVLGGFSAGIIWLVVSIYTINRMERYSKSM